MSLREELENAIRVASMPIAGWCREEKCTRLIRDHGPALLEAMARADRYEAVRKMNPPTFTKVFNHNVSTGIPFDTLVDTWAFNHGYPSALDNHGGDS